MPHEPEPVGLAWPQPSGIASLDSIRVETAQQLVKGALREKVKHIVTERNRIRREYRDVVQRLYQLDKCIEEHSTALRIIEAVTASDAPA
jgi:hypothetical protein